MRDWLRETVEPCLLLRETEVARDIVAASLNIGEVKEVGQGVKPYIQVE